MQAEVIAIGDELTSGQRLDTNSQWLSERLGELGVRVVYHTTVADDLEANCRVFRQAIERADVVVATGGLGPTADDLTREAIAQVAGAELVLDQASLEHIRGLFARRGRTMPERNVVQAMFPAGSRPIPNPDGTAPGIAMAVPRPGGNTTCHLFALPGVPAEMNEMWHESVVPALERLAGGKQVIRHRRLKCFGVGESELEQMLPDLIRRGRVPQVGITASGATLTLRVTAAGVTPEEAFAAMEPTIATIRQCLGELVFGEEDDELEHVVTRLLVSRRKTLATVESGTGGAIAHWMENLTPRSTCYRGGLVVAGPESLASMFGVPPELLANDPMEQTATAARFAQQRFEADYGLAAGAFPEETGSREPASVHCALASGNEVMMRKFPFAAHPSILKIRAAKLALNFVRLALLDDGNERP